ncbi:DUF1007 family protein [Devosia sp.]|uniref:HoxN/HupN/NixA family nickel/cobalt transporter n=1 Tax=Devosia sp. TaxID=1871048 RepID=UPI003A8F626B
MRFLTLVASLLLALIGPVMAHPHIWIDAKATLVFDDNGTLVEIRNAWTFDEAFSVWQVQGLDVDGDGITTSAEMQELADENVAGLAEYRFYSSLVDDGEQIGLSYAGGAKFVYERNRSTLNFNVAPEAPVSGAFSLAIADPEYYVAINFAGPQDIVLKNAPADCTVRLDPGHDVPPDVQERLGQLPPDVVELPPDLAAALRGAQGAIVVSCPSLGGAEPETALEATQQVAESRPSLPFGGPPAEPGFKLPRTGFLGWIQITQENFYRSLSGALSAMKSDWTGFWLLGGLSFLYGVFHAAGPGHGKVVIGSYMLANERQARRGIRLSVMAAMLQSVVAIVFVGIAAAILGLSATVMDLAVGWIEIAAYGLLTLLGLWLIARKLFGWGHSHTHDGHGHDHDHHHAHHHEHDHAHDHDHAPHGHGADDDHGHHHVVTADQVRGDWREQLGVVLGVGLRPCSGALLVLVFALTQGIFLAGVGAVFLMGLGTALTVSVLATMAVGAKGLARRFAGADNPKLGIALWWLELAGAVLVFAFGVLMLLAAL